MKFRLRLLIVAFSISFLLVGTLSAISYLRFSQLNDRVFWVEHSYKVSNLISSIHDEVSELDKAYFRYFITGNDSFRTQFLGISVPLMMATDSLRNLTADNKYQQSLIVLLRSDLILYLEGAVKTFDNAGSPDNFTSLQLYQDHKQFTDAAAGKLAKMSREEDNLLQKRNAERITYSQVTGDMIKALSIIFGLVSLILFFFLLREFRIRVLLQKQLQQKIAELGQSKNELEHIAYATSHDLQEPLRKIRILTDRWKTQQKDALSEGTIDTLERLSAASAKMQEMVTDLMVLTSLNADETTMPCHLRVFVQNAIDSISEVQPAAKAAFTVEELPQIDGHPDQLRLLFKNLLDNALKFSRPGIPPAVHISATLTHGEELGLKLIEGHLYHCISIQDNGLGFDNKMADKMFGIFRQLHSVRDGVSGKGTGLAVCHRIMSNHKGRITAHGFPGSGATFKLYFPAGNT